MSTTRGLLTLLALTPLIGLGGCTHHVAFQDIDYDVDEEPREERLIAVITDETREEHVTIRSWMVGFMHRWNAQPGLMLAQVSEVEIPQLFPDHAIVSSRDEADEGHTLHLSVPHYTFANHRATVRMRAELLDPEEELLFRNTYEEQGDTYGARMFWGGAFGMKSAMRNSSLEAYQSAFEDLRADLRSYLDEDG